MPHYTDYRDPQYHNRKQPDSPSGGTHHKYYYDRDYMYHSRKRRMGKTDKYKYKTHKTYKHYGGRHRRKTYKFYEKR